MATVPTPLDWIANDGALATAAMLQAGVGDVLKFLLDPPRAKLRQTVIQSIPTGVYTSISFTTEDFDNETPTGMHDPATNNTRATIRTAGTYLISGMIGFAANATGRRGVRYALNGSPMNGSQQFTSALASGGINVAGVTEVVTLSVNDFIEVQGFQDSGGALNTIVTGPETQAFMSVRWIGP